MPNSAILERVNRGVGLESSVEDIVKKGLISYLVAKICVYKGVDYGSFKRDTSKLIGRLLNSENIFLSPEEYSSYIVSEAINLYANSLLDIRNKKIFPGKSIDLKYIFDVIGVAKRFSEKSGKYKTAV